MSEPEKRNRRASLTFSEKIKLLEKLRDRSRAIAASGLKQKISKDANNPRATDSEKNRVKNYGNPLGQIYVEGAGSGAAGK